MKKMISALLISAAAVSAPAYAEGFMDGKVGSKYFAADLGQTSYGSGSATALSIGGGYQVHPAVAVEVDYLMGGKYTYSIFGVSATTQVNSLQVMAVGHYTFNSQWGAYAKAGISHNSYKSTAAVPFLGTVTTTATSNDLAFAIGGTFQVADNIKLRAQYQDVGVGSANVISIGAQFAF